MTEEELKLRAGKLLGDTGEKIWSDSEKGVYLAHALRQYSIDTGAFHGTFEIVSTQDGTFEYPDDFLSFLCGWDSNERVIVKSSRENLVFEDPEYRKEEGLPESLYEDDSEPGGYMVSPDPRAFEIREDGTGRYPYGVTFGNERGTEFMDGRGTFSSYFSVTGTGTALYERICKAKEVKDPTALLYYMLYEAYTSDSDFANAERGNFFLSRYKDRVSLFHHTLRKNSGYRKTSTFY